MLEFPPALAYGRVYLPTFDGRFYALDARTGRVVWHRSTGRCGWASPAVLGQLVYDTFLGQNSCRPPSPGRVGVVIAFDAATGRTRWRRVIGPTESSPLVARGLLYVGDWDGRAWALNARTGRTQWVRALGGPIKSSFAISGGIVYVGSYDGQLYALDAATGKVRWAARGGAFYSTPAVGYGKVYLGSTDGRVYAYSAKTGEKIWSAMTGSYVYSSPAVWERTIYIGSYDHSFYAFDAATGARRWTFSAGGPISGAPSVVAGLVYFSTCGSCSDFESNPRVRKTFAADARTGRIVWRFPDGEYSPVVADPKRLYLVGLGELYGLVERRPTN